MIMTGDCALNHSQAFQSKEAKVVLAVAMLGQVGHNLADDAGELEPVA